LDELGAHDAKITVTNDLDEDAIAALAAHPVDSYGVGTSLVTGSGAPTAGFVFKLVSKKEGDDWIDVSKRSLGKSNLPGRKQATRVIENNIATHDLITRPNQVAEGRLLQMQYVNEGTVMVLPSLDEARSRFIGSLEELPSSARRLSDGEPALAVTTF